MTRTADGRAGGRGVAARVAPLPAESRGTADFRRLLWAAAEVDDAELDRMLRDELPALDVLGVEEAGRLVAFVAVENGAECSTIEYIAVDEDARGRALGSALVEAVRSRASGRPVRAVTDDDAVGFYRRLGFRVLYAETDARWPDRRRYECVLAATP